MPTERSSEDIRSLANKFRGMLNERETQALSAVRTSDVKEVGAASPTPVADRKPAQDGVAERYRHLDEKKPEGQAPQAEPARAAAESRTDIGELRPANTPESPKREREGPSR